MNKYELNILQKVVAISEPVRSKQILSISWFFEKMTRLRKLPLNSPLQFLRCKLYNTPSFKSHFPGEPELAGSPFYFPSVFICKLCVPLGQA